MSSETTIAGGRCLACGHVFVPAQSYGCERCGAHGEQIAAIDLPAAGRVASAAVVHVHRFPVPPVPFAVAEIVLDAGPVVRVMLDGDAPARTRVVATSRGEDGLWRFGAAVAP